jgi:hypothetical protein
MSKNKAKETELSDIGKKLAKSQSKDALVKLLVVRTSRPKKKRREKIEGFFEQENNCGRSAPGALRS